MGPQPTSPNPGRLGVSRSRLPSHLLRVSAAVAPAEEILSFARPPGTHSSSGTAGRELADGTWGCCPFSGRAWLGAPFPKWGTPARSQPPRVQGSAPPAKENWVAGLCQHPGRVHTTLIGLPQVRGWGPRPLLLPGRGNPPEWLWLLPE